MTSQAMILAAGRGQRMLPLTKDIPKPLLQVGEHTLIDWHILRLKKAGITRLVVNSAYLGDQIVAHLGDGSQFGLDIVHSKEPLGLETAGGIKRALDMGFLEDAPFVLVNADVWTDMDMRSLTQRTLGGAWGHLVLVPNPAHNPEGDFVLRADKVYPKHYDGPTATFSGMSLLSPRLFERMQVQKAPLGPLLQEVADDKRLSAHLLTGVWHDIGTPKRLEEIRARVSMI